MIRKHIVVLALVVFCGNAHANLKKDASRIAVGVGIGAAGFAALQTAFNAVCAFVEQDASQLPGINYKLVRLSAVVGGVFALLDTTYMRTWRVHWNMASVKSNQRLIDLTMNNYESDAALVNALENYCVGCTYPLVIVHRELGSILRRLDDAALLLEQALADIEQDSLRAEDLHDWLDEIYMMRAYVAYAIGALDKDPRIHALIDAQNRLDYVDALWADAITHALVAASNAALICAEKPTIVSHSTVNFTNQ